MFYFSSLASFDDGTPFTFTQRQGDSRLVFWHKEIGWFVQDNVRLRPNLSIGLGLRYEWQNFLKDHNNFAPRFSFAYAPGKRRKTVLRGGAGVFYGRTGSGPIADVLRFNGRRLRRIDILNPGYPNPFLSGGEVREQPSSIVVFAPDARSPYSLHYTLGAERQLGRSTTVTATYIGVRGIKSFRSRDLNAPFAPQYTERPDPAVGVLRQIESSARSTSHRLKLGTQAQLSRFFQGGAYYTIGRSYDDGGGINSFPADSYDLSQEWSRSSRDARQRFYLYGTLDAAKTL